MLKIGPMDGLPDEFGIHGSDSFSVVGFGNENGRLIFRDTQSRMLFETGAKVEDLDLSELTTPELDCLEAAGLDVSWYKLDDKNRDDLLEWYNVTTPDEEDKARLAKLFNDGRFRAWDCPECGERVYEGSPDDWSHFQGVRQVDYASYPGNSDKYNPEFLAEMCDCCRKGN